MKVDTITRDELVDYLEGGVASRVDLGSLAVVHLPDGRVLVEPVTGDPVIISM